MTEPTPPPIAAATSLTQRAQEAGVSLPPALDEGRPCWLLFHPLAFAPTCKADLEAIQAQAAALGHPEVALVAVSVDAEGHARRFHEEVGAADLCAWPDPSLALARLCGVARDDGVCERASVLVGAGGQVVRSAVHAFCFPRPVEELVGWLPRLKGA